MVSRPPRTAALARSAAGSYGLRRLAAARAWRDQLLLEVSGPQYEVWKREKRHPSNSTGMSGVFRGTARDHSRVDPSAVSACDDWQALWTTLDGRRRVRSFSVNKFGEEAARALAVRARQEGLADVARESAERLGQAGLKKSA